MRRVLTIAATMAAISITTNALADDVAVAEQPTVETPATTAAPALPAPPPPPPAADPPIVAVQPVQPPPAFAAPKLSILQPKVADQPAGGKPEA